jgi:hypothetical protein
VAGLTKHQNLFRFGLVAVFAGGLIYGLFLHRNHLPPNSPLRPTGTWMGKIIETFRSPLFRLRYGAVFPEHADVVMLGDSLTEMADWHAIFPGFDVTNQGISGDTTAGLLDRVDLVIRVKPRLIAMMFGVNDLQQGQPVAEVYGRYANAIGELAAPERCIIVQSTLLTRRGVELNRAISDLNSRLSARCTGDKCDFVDLNASLAPNGELLADATVDGVHLTARGYSLWRDLLLPHLSGCHH